MPWGNATGRGNKKEITIKYAKTSFPTFLFMRSECSLVDKRLAKLYVMAGLKSTYVVTVSTVSSLTLINLHGFKTVA